MLFRLVTGRRTRKATAAARGVTPAPARHPTRIAARIEERLRAINSDHTPDESMGLALQALREEFGAVAAAFCLFDPRRRALRLAAEVGLSDEGCRHLRSAREGVPVGSLILITRAPRRLDETDVGALRPALRALALLTHDLRRRAGDIWSTPLAS